MGQDKAFLCRPDSTEPLWQRQLRVMREAGASELWVSARDDQHFAELPADVGRVNDSITGEGPLVGILDVLRRVEADRVMILAVDLPQVQPPDLENAVEGLTEGQGLVAKRDGRWEPLLAWYPRQFLAMGERRLREGQRSLQGALDEAVEAGLMRTWAWPADRIEMFMNVNTPEEWATFADGTG